MKKDFKLVFNYIKSYKSRSLAILLSFILGTALIIGVGTLSRGAQQANVDNLKRDLGSHHVILKNLDKEQLDIIKADENIVNLSVISTYGFTDTTEVLPINIMYADKNYLTDSSELLQGRFPENDKEVVLEEWVMTSLGLDIEPNQEITLKLYEKEEPETFKIVGVIKDRFIQKQNGKIEMFLGLHENKLNLFDTYISFSEDSNIDSLISEVSQEANVTNKEDIRRNSMLIDSIKENGIMDTETISTSISVSIFAGLVVYSIFSISIYQRIRDYGMLRAVGANNSRIFKLIFEEILLISLAGSSIGSVVGVVGAEIFNRVVGNIQIEGEITTSRFIIPWETIGLATVVMFIVCVLISLVTYLKIRKVSPIEAIRSQLRKKDNIKGSKLSLQKYKRIIGVTNLISIKNIFRNKKGFVVIMLSMSLGGFMFISTRYKSTEFEARMEKAELQFYTNGDFKISVNDRSSSNKGIGEEEIEYISKIDGIKDIKKANMTYTRMKLTKDKITDIEFFEYMNSMPYYSEDSYNGLLVQDEGTEDYILKQKIRGYDDNMMTSLEEYLVSGEIDIQKMKEDNSAVVYIPHPRGEKVVDIDVGDTVTVTIPQGKYNQIEFDRMEDDAEYLDVEFKVGAIVDYPYIDDNIYSGDSGVDIIIPDINYAKLMNNNTYNMMYLDIEEGADNKSINKELGSISKKIPGTIIQDVKEEREISKNADQKYMMYQYGIMIVLFVISMVNLLNSISYNLISRTSEFGMIRAIGISTEEFKKMIIFEGLFYGILSSVVVSVLSFLYQIYIYEAWYFAESGLTFKVAYIDYLLVIIANIGMGILATYIPSKKVKENSIVESINIIE